MFLIELPTESILYLVLYLVTLMLHVVAMNYVVGGAMVVAGAAVFRVFQNYCDATQAIVATLKDWLPFALGVTITLGVAPILFIQLLYKQAFYTANLLLFHRWMAILPVLIAAFYLLYLQKSQWIERRASGIRAVVAVGVLLMFLFVAWSWSENHLLSLAGQQAWTEHFAAGRMWHRTPELAPRLSLWMIGALPTLSVILAWQLRGAASIVVVRRLAIIGISGALGAIVAALWYWSVVPEAVLNAMRLPANVVLISTSAVGLICAVAAWLRMAFTGLLSAPWLWLATGGIAVAIPCATILREVRRYVGLVEVAQWQPAVAATRNAAQVQGFGLFLFFLLLNTLAIAWLLQKVRQQLKRRL